MANCTSVCVILILIYRSYSSTLLASLSQTTAQPTTAQETANIPVGDTPLTLLSKEFVTYREEKRENERLLNEAAEKLREEGEFLRI